MENTRAPGTHARESPQQILRIGHRGAAGHAPENTVAAIRRGVSLGADFVELDVRRTRDGQLVVIHDELTDRTTDSTGPVCEMTWHDLQLLDAGNGESVPCVEAALATANGHAGVILEVKTPGIGPDLHRVIRASAFRGPVIYASFLHTEILEIRRVDPLAETMALMECVPVSGAEFALEASATLVGLCHESATTGFIAALHDAGLKVLLYTVNEPNLIRRAIDLGADGVISDYPERIPKFWAEMEPRPLLVQGGCGQSC
ncbi:MAG TPA: glycerophosphodiester phosphodiesterase family protein [Terracidiphilus sp.]|nr:glycerophosphodiester phosphodiesterase family protein [Terracidiphilus sp.]